MEFGRVEGGRGGDGRRGVAVGRPVTSRPVLQSAPVLRFPSPLIEPDVRFSRIRLSDQVRPQGMRDGTSTFAKLTSPIR